MVGEVFPEPPPAGSRSPLASPHRLRGWLPQQVRGPLRARRPSDQPRTLRAAAEPMSYTARRLASRSRVKDAQTLVSACEDLNRGFYILQFKTEGAKVILTPVRSPNANAFAERWVRTARAEVFDWTIIVPAASRSRPSHLRGALPLPPFTSRARSGLPERASRAPIGS